MSGEALPSGSSRQLRAGRAVVALVLSVAAAAACSSASGPKAAGASPQASATRGPTASTSATPSPSSSASASPKASSTPPPCHARVGKCFTVLSKGDAVNVRKAPNTKAAIVKTISSGYQVEVLCVGKGTAVAAPNGTFTLYWDAVDQGWISDAYIGAQGKIGACR